MSHVSVLPAPNHSAKITLERDGANHWVATAHLVTAGRAPKILRARVDKRPFIAAFKAFEQQQRMTGKPVAFGHYHVTNDEFGCRVSGAHDEIGRKKKTLWRRFKSNAGTLARVAVAPATISFDALKLADKAAKTGAIKAVSKGVKDVVKSRYVGAGIGVLAVAFPPVGVPAAAAYASANLALSQIEKANSLKKSVERAVKSGSKPMLAYYKKNQKQVQNIIKQAEETKKKLQHMGTLAKQGDPAAIRDAKIVQLVAETREKQKKALGGRMAATMGQPIPGVLVTSSGKVVDSRWVLSPEAHAQSGLMIRKGSKTVEPGRFLMKIGQDIAFGCDCA